MAKVLLFLIAIGITCLAIDIGYVTAVRYEILNVEDASALAGALQREEIADGWDAWGRPNHWYTDINEAAAQQQATEAFHRNQSEKPLLRDVQLEQIRFEKMNRNRFKVSVTASAPLPLTTKVLQAFGYATPLPWPIVAESLGGFP